MSSDTEIKDKIIEIVRGNSQLSADSPLSMKTPFEDAGLDSVDINLIGFAIEDHFEIEFDEPTLMKLENLSDIVDFVSQAIKEKA